MPMKKLSLKNVAVFALLLIMQYGCWEPNTNRPDITDADKLRYTGNQFFAMGNADSAIFYYNKSLIRFKNELWLYRYHDSIKDTLTGGLISKIDHNVGIIYDSLKNYNTSTAYFLQALKWNIRTTGDYQRIEDETNLSYNYLMSGKNSTSGSGEQKSFYLQAQSHINKACNYVDDSHYNTTEYAKNVYKTAFEIYQATGDKTKADSLEKKYNDILSHLNTN
jgi:tetratricopeptide (TPR) repeat protein